MIIATLLLARLLFAHGADNHAAPVGGGGQAISRTVRLGSARYKKASPGGNVAAIMAWENPATVPLRTNTRIAAVRADNEADGKD